MVHVFIVINLGIRLQIVEPMHGVEILGSMIVIKVILRQIILVDPVRQ
jgi:hypothetical protein